MSSLLTKLHECNDIAGELNEALVAAEKSADAADREVSKAYRKDAKAQQPKGV